jgi:beta-glucanase (GH16 family)
MPARRLWRSAIVVGGICAAIAVTGLSYGPKLVSAHSTPGWSLVWNDAFTGGAWRGVHNDWTYEIGQNFGNDEVAVTTNSASNIRLDGAGDLDIIALHTGSSWTSGRIQTIRTFTVPVGSELKVVASIKQPAPADGLGYWPAFWLLGQGTWPEHGEIDIMEDVNALSDTAAAFHCGNLTAHNADGTLGPCHEHTGFSSGVQPCAECQSGYQQYSMVVDRRTSSNQQITWYLNGRKTFDLTEQQVGAQVWTEALNSGFKIIFDLAIGGTYPNSRCDCTTPTAQTSSGGTMSVQYVGVYSG